MRELQLSPPRFKIVKRICRRQISSRFWTESILPECREVQLLRFSEGKWRREPTSKSCNLPKASTRSFTPRARRAQPSLFSILNIVFNDCDISASPMRYIVCLWQTIRYALRDIFRFAERDCIILHYILYHHFNHNSTKIAKNLSKTY